MKPNSFTILLFFFLSSTFAQLGSPPTGQNWGGESQRVSSFGLLGGNKPSSSNKMFGCLASLGTISSSLDTIMDSFSNLNNSAAISSNLTAITNNMQYFLTECASTFFSGLAQGNNAPNQTFDSCGEFINEINSTILDITNSWMTNSQQALSDIQLLISIIPQGSSLCWKPPGGGNNRVLSENRKDNSNHYLCMEQYLEVLPEVSKAFTSIEMNHSLLHKMTDLLTNVLPIFEECQNESYENVRRMLLIMNVSSCADHVFVMAPMIESHINFLKSGNEAAQDALVSYFIENGDRFLDECNIEGIFDRVPPIEEMMQKKGCLEELDSVGEALGAFGNNHDDPLYKLKLMSEAVMHAHLAYAHCVAE